MEPAPIPPHERRWRHPSELAQTTADEDLHVNARLLFVATGTTALLLAAVMVIALTPTRSTSPSAVSATTLPTAAIELQSPAPQLTPARTDESEQDLVRTFRSTIQRDVGVALIGAPNSVSAAPVGDADDFAIAGHLPDPRDRVILLTSSHTYVLRWDDMADIAAPNGSIVMTQDGWLVATFVSGELRLLVN